ncbi:twin-arginine translocation signal domain-containing protein [Rhodococcus opacus]|nr:twin-arginine translocation signal domain-containing protein [Rhodococcus opacus]
MRKRRIRGINRRDFVTKAALLGAGLVAGPSLLAACSISPWKTPGAATR